MDKKQKKIEDKWFKIRQSQLDGLLRGIHRLRFSILCECCEEYVNTGDVYWPAFDLDDLKGCGLSKEDTLRRGPVYIFEKIKTSSFKLVGPDPDDPTQKVVLSQVDHPYFDDEEEDEGEDEE